MIEPHWRRIAGVQVQPDGAMAVVWGAHDKDTDTVHLYDACIFNREVMAVMAEGLNARGRWIPVAWEYGAREIADQLLDRGCNVLPDPYKETDPVREMTSRDIWERMRSGRFKVDKRLKEWTEEYKTYYREGSKVPGGDSHPMMAATRHVMANLDWARAQRKRGVVKSHSPKLAVI